MERTGKFSQRFERPPPPLQQMANEKLPDRRSRTQSIPDMCLVCCEVFDNHTRFMAFGPCNHLGICSLCCLRMRVLMKDMNCMLCKTPMDTVMVEPSSDVRPFEHYEIWGENAGPDKVYDEAARMFLPRDYHKDTVSKLQEFRCRLGCGQMQLGKLVEQRFGSLRKLEDHYREKHGGRGHCHTCLAHKRVFLAEQAVYTKGELGDHIGKGDPREGFFGHPKCEFCRCRFYDKDHLHMHLTKDHYSCHLCERAGLRFRYYKDYDDVERHFRAEHLLCEHPRCLEKKFVVFDNDFDLQAHNVREHPELAGGGRGGAKIKLNFTVKARGFDGSGFERADGGIAGRRRRGEDGAVHEWQVSGIEASEENQAMEEAARAARAAGLSAAGAPPMAAGGGGGGAAAAEDFPSLAGGPGGGGGGPASWSVGRSVNGPGGRPRGGEAFPGLPAPSQPLRRGGAMGGGGGPGGRGVAGYRNALQPYATPAMEIYAQRGSGWEYPGSDGGGAAAAGGEDFVASLPRAKSKKKKGKGGGGGGGGGGGPKQAVDLDTIKAAQAPLAGGRLLRPGEREEAPLVVPRPGKGGGGGGAPPPAPAPPPPPPPPPPGQARPAPLPAAAAARPARPPAPPGVPSPSDPPPGGLHSLSKKKPPPPVESPQQKTLNGLREAIGEEGFASLKSISQLYRSGGMTAEDYYEQGMALIGTAHKNLFITLVGQLPDLAQRRAVLELAAKMGSSTERAAAAAAAAAAAEGAGGAGGGRARVPVQKAQAPSPRGVGRKGAGPGPPGAAAAAAAQKKPAAATGLSVVRPAAAPTGSVRGLPGAREEFPSLGAPAGGQRRAAGGIPPGLRKAANNANVVSDPGLVPMRREDGNDDYDGPTGATGKKGKKKGKKGKVLMNELMNFK